MIKELKRASLCVAVVAIAMCVTYWPWLRGLGGAKPSSGPMDSWAYFGPNAFFFDEALRHGEWPLWNPLVFCGTPFAANPQTKLFYPPNVLRSLLTPGSAPADTYASLKIYFFAHMLLGGVATFFLARRLGLSAIASTLSAYAFTFSGVFVMRMCNFHFIDVIAWLPLQMLTLDRVLAAAHSRTRLRDALVAGVIFALAFLAGYPQVFMYGAIVSAVFVVMRVFIAPPTTDSFRLFGQRLIAGAVALAIAASAALFASAVIVLPAAELLHNAARQGSASIAGETTSSVRSWIDFAKVLLLFRGPGNFTPGLCGLTVLVLALVSFLQPNKRVVLLCIALFYAAVDLSIGPPFPLATLTAHVSPFSLPVPKRGFVIAALPLALAAGLGADQFAAAGVRRPAGRFFTFLVAAVGLVSAAYAFVLSRDLWYPYDLPGEDATWRGAVFAVPVLAVGVMCLSEFIRLRFNVSGLLFVLVVAELGLWNMLYVPYFAGMPSPVSASVFRNPSPGISITNRRVVDEYPNAQMHAMRPAVGGYEPATLKDSWKVLSSARDANYNRVLDGRTVGQESPYANSLLKRPFWLVPAFVRGKLPADRTLFPPASIAFVDEGRPSVVPEIMGQTVPSSSVSVHRVEVPIEGWTPENGGSVVTVALPRYTKHSALLIDFKTDSRGQLLTEFFGTTVKFGPTAAISATGQGTSRIEVPLPDTPPSSIKIWLRIFSADGNGSVTKLGLITEEDDEDTRLHILEWTPNSVEVEASELPAYRLLVFTDAYYVGWSAMVDGSPTTIFKTDGAFKSVEVPPGTHRIRFLFRSTTVMAGGIISAVTWTLVLAAIGFLSRRRCNATSIKAA